VLDLVTIALEAHSDERNHHRRYEVSVGRDLLDDWVVTVRYGRVGWPLREVRFGYPDVETARTLLTERLSRRLSAPRRIGCAYRIRELRASGRAPVSEWIDPELVMSMS